MSALAFELPSALEAHEPPEARGVARDDGQAAGGATTIGRSIEHRRFHDLPELLAPGDLLVVNVSATLPAAIAGRRRRRLDASGSTSPRERPTSTSPGAWSSFAAPTASRPATGARRRADRPRRWRVARARRAVRVGRAADARPGSTLDDARRGLPGAPRRADPLRLRRRRRGRSRPTRTSTRPRPGAPRCRAPGGPSRAELITRLLARGVLIAPITLHAGVSSPERHEPPFPEYYEVPEATARLVEATRDGAGA